MIKVNKKAVAVRENKLQNFGEELVALEKHIRELRKNNEALFELVDEYEAQKEILIDQIKTEARKQSKEGDTAVLIQGPDLFVSVTSRNRPWSYDVNMAREVWPEYALTAALVQTIDAKKVAELVTAKKLTAAQASEAGHQLDLPTPAVTVRLP